MSTNADTAAPDAPLEQAFNALAAYDLGSSRATLKPIDDAVMAASQDARLGANLEPRLVAALRSRTSAVGKEYACGKLALIGGPLAVPALAELLPNPDLAHPATNALQLMPCAEAATALREGLAKLTGLPLAGVATALGARRDAASVDKLAALLTNPDTRAAAAAAAALGGIGNPEAASALRAYLSKAPIALHAVLADACLTCAERLKAGADAAAARPLLEALSAINPPPYVQAAIRRLQG